VEFRLLGPVECVVDGSPVALGRPQERCLLAVLLVGLGGVVPVGRLVDLLWDGEAPDRARSIVHTHVSRLRAWLRAAGAQQHGVRLVTRGQGYLLEAAPESVDAFRFRRLVEQAHEAGAPALAARFLTEALSLWRGPALADVATRRVREQICAGLDELRMTATEDRIEAELALGRHHAVVTRLTGVAVARPLRERTVGLLMLALYRSGQQARALETYRLARRMLIDELGIEPGHQLRRLEQAILAQDPALDPVRTGEHRPVDGPGGRIDARPGPWRGPRSHLTSIVGRDQQLAQVARLLGDHRLVTIVGAGGVGKTTLALHAAEAVRNTSVVVATLATARTEDDVILALAGLLGIDGATVVEARHAVEERLADGPYLLVLDNCEHLVRACAAVVRRLLSASARLVVLATSRQPLELPEETVWRLAPLGLTAEDPADAPAVALFLRRAGSALAGSPLGERELAAVVRVCRRVDGLPLALELAAGRLTTMRVEHLAEQLERGFGVLTPAPPDDPHRRTLRATLDWSFRLLTPDEQRLLARLAVFRAGFTTEAAAAVGGAGPIAASEVPRLVALLAERSLVQAYESGCGVRYRLLEVVREYAGEQLDLLDERSGTAGRHLDHWLIHARAVYARPQVDEQLAGWTELADELDNLRAAAEDGYLAGRHVDAVELAILALECLMANNAYAEQERWMEQMSGYLDRCPPRLRCLVQLHRSGLQTLRDDPVSSLRAAEGAYADLAVHHPLSYLDAQITRIRSKVHLLDPAALEDAVRLHARLRTADDRHIRVHSVAMVTEALVKWGRYDDAGEVCARDAPPRDRLDSGSELRYDSALSAVQLGLGQVAAAAQTAARLRDRLGRPGYLALNTPAYSFALVALATQPPLAAVQAIAGMIQTLSDRYPSTLSRAYALTLLLAEAQRRAGNATAALRHLVNGLEQARSRTMYAVTVSAAISAAMLAGELGDPAGAARLTESWNRLRVAAGLPAPLGFAEQTAQLGLDPGPPDAPDPGYAWEQAPLRNLIADVHAWSVRTMTRAG
jgi:predicted ATPase/DNA-binding SARP family transcriptional activator